MDNILKLLTCKQSYKYQGPRFIKLGSDSGEEFRDSYLIPWLEKNKGNDNLTVDFEGTVLYTPSFLEESFGGAVRKNYTEVKNIKFINLPDKYRKKISEYIENALSKIKK